MVQASCQTWVCQHRSRATCWMASTLACSVSNHRHAACSSSTGRGWQPATGGPSEIGNLARLQGLLGDVGGVQVEVDEPGKGISLAGGGFDVLHGLLGVVAQQVVEAIPVGRHLLEQVDIDQILPQAFGARDVAVGQ